MKRFIAAAAALLVAASASAQSYPSRPISMVVGFAPGGGTDTAARIIAKRLGENMSASVVVENKAGAGGNIATDFVAKAEPDGYTILLGSVGSLTVAPHTVAKLAYDPLRDLAPITMAVVFANVLVIHPSVPAKNLAEYVQLARQKPGALTFGSSGINGAGHLAGELFKIVAKVDIVHVPYKGGGPAASDLLGGQITSIFAAPPSVVAHIRSGRMLAIATTGAQRSAFLPDVPTVAESGFPGYEATNWYAYVAPAKTPKDIVERLNRELVRVLEARDIREQLQHHGMEAQPGTSEALAQYMAREYATWGRVVKEAKIKTN